MRFTMAAAALSAAFLLAACASATVGMRSGAAPPMGGSVLAPGSSYSSAAIQAQASPNAYFGWFFLGVYAAAVEDHYRNSRETPQLAADRAIAERDCSRPMEAPSANLRCR